jgi:hypothetical protein
VFAAVLDGWLELVLRRRLGCHDAVATYEVALSLVCCGESLPASRLETLGRCAPLGSVLSALAILAWLLGPLTVVVR